jgi:hypothetical protein
MNNPYQRDKQKRMAGLVKSVTSSSAIEGISANHLIKEYLLKKNKHPNPSKTGQLHP